MNKNLRIEFRLLLLLIDYLIISALFFYFLYFRFDYLYKEKTVATLLEMFKDQYKAYLLILVSWFLISEFTNFYRSPRFLRYLNYIRRLIYQLVLFAFILYTVSGIKVENLFTNRQSFYFLSILTLYVFISRTAFFFLVRYYLTKGYNLKNLIIIGSNDNSKYIIDLIREHNNFGLKLLKIFECSEISPSDLDKFLKTNKIDYAYISLGKEFSEENLNKFTETLEDHYISIGFIPSTALESKQSLEINYLDSFPILTYKRYPLEYPFNQITKRVFDLIFASLIFFILLWWLIPLLSIMVYFSQGRPIFYAQKRNGLNGKEFDCLKFRTMRPDKSNDKKPTERDDPRVTKLGKILRKTSLDELPQFFNVLKGDMSIVGPRPHMVSENESYSEIIKKYSLRHYVKPGITGLAQIRGYRGAIDSEKDMELRVRTDIYYVRNWSFLLDLLIIYKTVRLILVGDENAI
ncbi:MAG: exopolysaccharide biosynthesis polyprenyl glycosylphosphotransferase [Moheibacter sp.]